MIQARLIAVSPHEREDLEAALRDFEQHFAELMQLPRVPRPFERDPFATPGLKVYWLERQGKRLGFVFLDRIELAEAKFKVGADSHQVEAIQISRYGVFSEFRNRGSGSAGLLLLEEYATASGRPLT